MARYIDADILLQHWVALLGININACLSIETLKHDLDKIPTADVQEVKHGHWDNNICSVCNYEVMPWNTTPYCHNCGAKMDEEVE